jgi:hypothetical protein
MRKKAFAVGKERCWAEIPARCRQVVVGMPHTSTTFPKMAITPKKSSPDGLLRFSVSLVQYTLPNNNLLPQLDTFSIYCAAKIELGKWGS